MKKYLLILIIILAFVLRFYKLDGNPPSLYWDEVSLGYNAYSIAQTGKDEHGERWPLARFIAFGDYKPPGYIYTTALAVKTFGLSEWSVRSPSALAGVLMVLVTYFLVNQLFRDQKLALLSSFFLAISPWALQFSRGAFEANLAAFFNLLAVLLFFLAFKKRWILPLSAVFFVASFYTFNANRIIAPLLALTLFLFYFREIWAAKKWVLFSLILAILLLLPSFKYLTDRESRLRFTEVSIFKELDTVKLANQRIEQDQNVWWAKIVHNRRLLFAQSFLTHYFDHFKGKFLFISGDVNPRLSIQEVGELYLWDLPFLLAGVYFLIKRKEKGGLVLAVWLGIVLIPAATARETPHALRTLSSLPTWQITTAYGFFGVYFLVKKRWKTIFLLLASCFLFLSIFYYLHMYWVHYSRDWSQEWQYGYKEMVQYVSSIEGDYDQIVVTEAMGRPYIYFLFYKKYPPQKFWQERKATRDWWGLWEVNGFGKYRFGLESLKETRGRILFVGVLGEIPEESRQLKTIYFLNGKPAFKIVEVQPSLIK